MSTVAWCTRPLGSRSSSTVRRPPPVSTTSVSPPRPASAAAQARPRMPLPLISAMPPSALCSVMVGVGAIRSRGEQDQAVGPDPGVPVAQGAGQPGRHRGGVTVEHRPHEEVVAGGVELGEGDAIHHRQHSRSAGARSVRIRRGAPPGDAGVPPEPPDLAAGELAGAQGGGRPGRVHRRLGTLDDGERLPVADGLGGGARERRAPRRRERGHLVEQAVGVHAVDPGADAGVEHRTGAARSRACAPGTPSPP